MGNRVRVVVLACVLGLACSAARAGSGVAPDRAIVDEAGVRAALAAVEANRAGIVARVVEAHAAQAAAHGVSTADLHAALRSLRADGLLGASLAASFDDVTAIVAREAADGTGTSFVAKDAPGSGANSWIGYTGGGNVASGTGSAAVAGRFNAATGQNAIVVGGQSNVAAGLSSLVIGGFDNQAKAVDALVGAGAGNRATGARSVVVGGGYNLASGQWSFVGGGGRQSGAGPAGSDAADNVAAGDWSTIGGGASNRAGIAADPVNTSHSAIAGGLLNTATGRYAAIAGGLNNRATQSGSTVTGGISNSAEHFYATVSGGFANLASGQFSVTVGGRNNVASGDASFAAGNTAHAQHEGCFVWSDSSAGAPTSCFQNNEFVARARGGFWFFTGGSSDATYVGASLPPGAGAWEVVSDRNAKADVRPVDVADVLRKVAAMPVATWRWKSQDPSIRHMGPMAQDFHAAFGLGERNTTISTVDADGVALAAIQGLKQALDARDAEIELLKRKLRAIEARLGLE